MAAPKMNVTELDFFQIKANLKTFFEAKPEFSDYDFDGSGLSTLLDIMAYTVHYMGVYSNAAFNENFLDAAILRSSAVSRAKELGYFPGQNSSASANIKISISGQTPGRAAINVPSGTQFTSSKDNVSFTFKTKQNYTLTETVPGVFENSSIEIVEGRDGQQTYTWAIADPSPILINQKI